MYFRFQSFHKISSLLILCLFTVIGQINAQEQETKNLVILHMNDTHSRIEPMPSNDSRNANKGGAVRQNTYIEKVRKENKDVLLFHCGDFVQGTPYFNLFGGEAEVAIMNFMKFDAACIGNHEFDNGLENLAQLIRQSNFPFIATNLDFTGTPAEGLTQPYLILAKEDIRIGIIGLAINPNGLIAQKNYDGMKWLDPIQSANKMADYLREEQNCDLIICLSHLGIYFSEEEVGDITLAKQSRNIDIILGGHTHTFLRAPERIQNLEGKEVVINQMGGNGIYVGRLDVMMEDVKK